MQHDKPEANSSLYSERDVYIKNRVHRVYFCVSFLIK